MGIGVNAIHSNFRYQFTESLSRIFMLKTHNCGELRATHVGQEVTLAGWVNRRRDQGGLIFIDVRDRWGLTQATINAQTAPDAHKIAAELGPEYLIQVSSILPAPPEALINNDLPT